jgi:hypothetical protein
MYKLQNKIYFTPIFFLISVPMAKLCPLGDYRKCPLHRKKGGSGKLRNKEIVTGLVAYSPSLVAPQKKSTKADRSIMAIQSNKTLC